MSVDSESEQNVDRRPDMSDEAQVAARPGLHNSIVCVPPSYLEREAAIDLSDIWRILWRRRWLVTICPIACAVVAAGFSLLLPNLYRGDVLLAPVQLEGSGSNVLGNLDGLATLAGLSVPTGSNTAEHVAILQSREFVWRFIDQQQLMPVLFSDDWDKEAKTWLASDADLHPTRLDGYRKFIDDVLRVSTDQKTGLVEVSVDWTDPVLASEWANELVRLLNEYLRAKAIQRSDRNLNYLDRELARSSVAETRDALYQLIAKEQRTKMLANTQPEFAFRVVDPSVVPDRKVKPKRLAITVLAAFGTGLLVFVYVLIEHAIRKGSSGSHS